AQIRALRELLEESVDGVITPLPDDAPDAAQWRDWDRGHYGKPWSVAPFLWAESYFFRRILQATGYFAAGSDGADDSAGDSTAERTDAASSSWAGVDPYEPMKSAELADPQLEAGFAWYAGLAELAPDRRFAALVEAAVLGNRADLVFKVTEVVDGYTSVNPPLADDTTLIHRRLTGHGAPVAFLCDNAGRELISDLLLADELLATNAAASVELHVKPVPYYISDATAADVGKCLRRLRSMPGALGEAGRRLYERAAAGRLRTLTHPFWTSPLDLRELPAGLRTSLAGRFLVVKGDLNYRRLVGDRRWDPATPFADAAGYLGLPLAALRAAKSDVVVGLGREQAQRLDAAEPDWRLNGRHSLIQTA
ncbi:MAG: ARMT1-like domain-containing protein, partial [Actinocrinis sp.]